MNHLDITLDLETTALSAHAAIMQIAAVAWNRFADSPDELFFAPTATLDDTEYFVREVDLNSQFVEGLWDFDQRTSEWWRRQSTEAKRAVLGFRGNITHSGQPLDLVLRDFQQWQKQLMEQNATDNITLWCQGTDFDIPILRYAAEKTGQSDLLPPHKHFRDCRTAIYECTAAWLARTDVQQPYSKLDLLNDPTLAYRLLPPLPDTFGSREHAHGALYDAVRSSWFTWQALSLI